MQCGHTQDPNLVVTMCQQAVALVFKWVFLPVVVPGPRRDPGVNTYYAESVAGFRGAPRREGRTTRAPTVRMSPTLWVGFRMNVFGLDVGGSGLEDDIVADCM